MVPGDLARPYVALLRAALVHLPQRPAPTQAAALRVAVGRLRAPIGAADMEAVAEELAGIGR
jgi:hypothetical protein